LKQLNSENNFVPEKRQLYKFKSGASYKGEWVGNARHGYGK
jgi:hypothetical protein